MVCVVARDKDIFKQNTFVITSDLNGENVLKIANEFNSEARKKNAI
jgi:hypothetical protein